MLNETRKEEDFAKDIENVIATDPNAGWVFVLDHLNTHLSEMLVILVATLLGITMNLGVKGKSGVLYHYQLRFPECASVYPTGKRTPTKHCVGFFNRLGYKIAGESQSVFDGQKPPDSICPRQKTLYTETLFVAEPD